MVQRVVAHACEAQGLVVMDGRVEPFNQESFREGDAPAEPFTLPRGPSRLGRSLALPLAQESSAESKFRPNFEIDTK